jgi:hypothetical protein
MEEEIWKEIEGYDGMYEVSNMGRVRSWKKRIGFNKFTRGDLPVIRNLNFVLGYFHCHLSKNGISKAFKVHRLVAIHFIDNPENHRYVDHIDGNKQNNYVSNLRWVNKSQNEYNSKKGKNNTSGVKGVYYFVNGNNWRAFWEEDGKQKFKGFKTKEEAIEHRRQMVELHYSKEHYIEDR